MNLDDEVRGTLFAHADEAPSGEGTLDTVRARERRLQKRHRMGTAGVAAVLAVAAAVSAPYLLASRGHGSGPAKGGGQVPAAHTTSPAATPTRSVSSVPVEPSRVALEPATFATLQFPLTPTWTPPGLAAPTVGRSTQEVRLVYSNTDNTGLMDTVSAQKGRPDWTPDTTKATTVRGRPATLFTGTDRDGHPAVMITWQLQDGRWVTVASDGPLTSAQVKQYAEGLDSQPMTPPALPFAIALAPHGFQVGFQEIHPELTPSEFYFCLAPPGQLDDQGPGWLCTDHQATSGDPAGGDPVQVGPDPGEIVHSGTLITLTVHRPGFPFSVTENVHGPLSVSDLINFAIGVTHS